MKIKYKLKSYIVMYVVNDWLERDSVHIMKDPVILLFCFVIKLKIFLCDIFSF